MENETRARTYPPTHTQMRTQEIYAISNKSNSKNPVDSRPASILLEDRDEISFCDWLNTRYVDTGTPTTVSIIHLPWLASTYLPAR